MDIKALKSRLDIIEVAEKLGIVVHPRTLKALCPFHDDKNPSLQFSKEKQICTCFSSNCTAGTMDVISLTEKKLNVSTHEALIWLKELAGEPLLNKQPLKKQETGQNPEVLKNIFSSFESTFLASKHAKAYAQSRHLKIKTLKVGYNSGQFHHGENKHLIPEALKAGLLMPKINSGGYPVFGIGSLVFALRDPQHQITGLYFRAVEPRPPKLKGRKYEKHLYLKNRKGLYPKYPETTTKRLILTESIIDAATLLSIREIAEKYTVLALYGTNGFTVEHSQAIKELKEPEEVILFFDGDKAGQTAVKRIAEQLLNLRPSLFITSIATPQDEDINSLLDGHSENVLLELLQQRKRYRKPEEPHPTAQAVQSQPPLLNTGNANNITYQTATATYSIKGGIRKDLDSLKVTLVIKSNNPETNTKSRNKLDLYEDKQTERVARESAEKLGLRADLIENDLSVLTDLLDNYRDQTMPGDHQAPKKTTLSAAEKEQCLTFLKRPDLLKRINELIGKSGVVGEETNRIFLFGIASSYKMPETLHALIQGSSGSGKTHLLSKIMGFMPSEDTISLTRVTESSFYNYGKYELQNKLIGMEDYDGLEEKAELAFRELQSKGMISSSTSGKNEHTGEISGFIKEVYGPIASLSATTKGEVYEDNMSRCFLVAVDESHEQTQRIIKYQNKRSAGKVNKEEERSAAELLRNCIRLLKPCEVINPYADKIDLPKESHKIRRLNDLFQCYVRQVTILNQYQRQRTPAGELITQKEDLQTAIEIMFDSIILKVDELDGSLRLFYEELKNYVNRKGKEYEFIQREIRHALKISKTQLFRYIHQLEALEYLQKKGYGVHGAVKYKIVYWDNNEVLRARIKDELNKQLEQL